MKIFKLFSKVNGYASIDFSKYPLNEISKGICDVAILSNEQLEWNKTEDDNEIGDSPFFIGVFPVFESSKLASCNLQNCNTAKFKVEGDSYTIVSAPILNGSFIDKEVSELRLFKSGKIMSVKKFALRKNTEYPSIFRIEEYPLYTFVQESVINQLQKAGFNQLRYEECIITEK